MNDRPAYITGRMWGERDGSLCRLREVLWIPEVVVDDLILKVDVLDVC